MSGKIKTGSSTWSSVSEMRVKTSQNTWSAVSKAYVKTAANTWSQWFIAPIKDAFGRTTSGSLGNADSGQAWSSVSGTWFSNGTRAQSDNAAGSYPVARVDYGDVTATVAASPSPGTGPAVWVTSTGDWYAAVLFQDQVDGTYPCNCTCNNTVVCDPNPCYSYSCPPCSTSSGSTQECVAAGQTPSGGYWSYVGLSNKTWNGSSYTYSCSVGEPGHPYNNGCYVWVTTYSPSCPSGYSYNGSQCCRTVPTTTCNAPCVTGYGCGCTNVVVSGGSYPNCSNGYTCQQCGTLITRNFLRLLKSVGGTVTSAAVDISLPSTPAAIKISTAGGVLSYTAYSDSAMTISIGSGSHTPTTPITSTYHGIVKSPSTYAQGSTVDDFLVLG